MGPPDRRRAVGRLTDRGAANPPGTDLAASVAALAVPDVAASVAVPHEAALTGPGVWAGPECSYLTVGRWQCDQLALTRHDRREDDLDRIAGLSVSAVRYPVIWGRSADATSATDWTWAEARVGRLVELGIEPIVGLLHHGFGPEGSDPLDPGWPAAFGRYAGEVARRLPDTVSFLPINEPLTTARFGALYGWWSPYARDSETFASLLLAECEAFVEAAEAIRRVRPAARILVNEDVGRTEGTRPLAPIIDHHNERRWLTFDLLMGRVDPNHPLWPLLGGTRERRRMLDRLRRDPQPPDILGVDHYITSDRFLDDRLERYPSWTHAEEGPARYANVELVRIAGSTTDGFRGAIADTWQRYGLPVALTEVQLAGNPVDQTAWWLEAWIAAKEAVARGIPVAGVTAWSVFGAFDWSSVLREPRGSYEPGCFDIRPSRDGDGAVPVRRTPLADVIAATARGTDTPPVTGWWRRDDRTIYDPEASAEHEHRHVASEDEAAA